ncbi:probable ADP-ribosylation factor GTPase-activating protein AGD14 isoform X2 [Humulus lupulus]|uniref:probable ADP-ribosylation factor GTPase-activating protein AGD14 isoform X2 n=1 Tax=Humulus lupulus TaxID=3486 RepID=UPI002B409639|nr:probable ADP-ribosylation factor GTPase-activating protein AGD14 isoform X2 [Humulus lupulus]
MGSRKEEERNEKIIRGLMKLPPNRKCINCNSLGPQYVCTNFWSFVCIACSGIHREFTHRVKSVSMAKFTSQEVEALQNGGNQRAREIYLKDWDIQRHRFPDSSNVDKVRQFIKDVYVDRKYAGGKTTDKPPRDTQNRGLHEDDTRRASSYHSYSQSPPYDHQYEDRRYGKQAAALTRKPGSDRGRYEGKMSSFIYSPGRLSEQMYEDRFANDGSNSRVSDYSVSSGGDPFRSGTQSPSFRSGTQSPSYQKDTGFSSPPFHSSRDVVSEDVKRQAVDSFPQRSRSSGSFGSIEGNFVPHKSFSSGGLTDIGSHFEQAAGAVQDQSSFNGSPVLGSSGNLDLFKSPSVPETVSSSAQIDLFQLPEAPAPLSVDLFQPSVVSSTSPPPSLDLFAVTDQLQSTTISNEKIPEFPAPKNEGWATFDTPQSTTPINLGIIPSNSGESLGKVDLFSSFDTSMQWPSFQDSSYHSSLNISSPWNDSLQGVTAPNPNSTNTQLWNAFEDTVGQHPLEGFKQDGGPLVGIDGHSSTANQDLAFTASENSNLESIQRAASHGEPPGPVPSLAVGPSYTPPMLPLTGETQSHSTDRKSNNPFDLPYDSEPEENNMFLDMSSLQMQGALPDAQLPSSYLGGLSEPWFPQNSATPYIPDAGQGGVTYLSPQVPSSQIQNVPAQGPVASSIGGNPFA